MKRTRFCNIVSIRYVGIGDFNLERIAAFFTCLISQVRSQVAYGSVGEVERFEKLVGVKAMAGAEA